MCVLLWSEWRELGVDLFVCVVVGGGTSFSLLHGFLFATTSNIHDCF